MKFGVGMKIRARNKRPATATLWGRLIFAIYIGSFLFYAYCRVAHTMDQHSSAFAYQVCSWLLYAYNMLGTGHAYTAIQLAAAAADLEELVSDSFTPRIVTGSAGHVTT